MSAHPLLAVVGASGGLGCSTLTVALARRAEVHRGAAFAVDLAQGRGGLDVAAGIDHLPGLRWADLQAARGAMDGVALRRALPGLRGVHVLSFGLGPRAPVEETPADPPPDTVAAVVAALVSVAPVVLDAPDIPRLVPLWPLRPRVVLLTGLHAMALADLDASVRALERAPEAVRAVTVVVTRGRRAGPGLRQSIEDHVGLSVAGHLADDAKVAAGAERGDWPGHARDESRRLAEALWCDVVEGRPESPSRSRLRRERPGDASGGRAGWVA